MDDIQNPFKETIAEFMENGLCGTRVQASRLPRNKNTENSQNGHSGRTLRISFSKVDVAVPGDSGEQFEPQLLKRNQISVSQDIEEKILSMYAKGMTTGDIEAHIRDILAWKSPTPRSTSPMGAAHRKGMAADPTGERLRGGISGRHPLPHSQRGTDR